MVQGHAQNTGVDASADAHLAQRELDQLCCGIVQLASRWTRLGAAETERADLQNTASRFAGNPRRSAYRQPMQLADAIQLPKFESALGQSVRALRHIADFELEPGIQQRMLDLGERKEFLSDAEHSELLSLVGFSERRNLERLEAQVALKNLGECVPELVAGP